MLNDLKEHSVVDVVEVGGGVLTSFVFEDEWSAKRNHDGCGEVKDYYGLWDEIDREE
jgi:hypothetical protein